MARANVGTSSCIIRRVPLTRRELLSGVIATTAAAFSAKLSLAQETTALRINPARLQQSLEGLSVYGRPSGGTFADGVSRVAYSDADVAGRKYAMDVMRAAGLDPRIDTAGNITTVRPGSDASLKPILVGSHIDSVPSGGNFDGDLGSMSAIEVMHTLHDRKVTTRHPLQTVIWQDEEGGLVGSRIAAGDSPDLERRYNGIRLADGLRKIGGDPARLEQARIAPGSFRCYL
ncbi:MAG TPA: M28 family peptidase, partial [Terriglobales bacterium]|nr:M28 family peptidase [Terriglobales bacterium]